MYDIPTIRELLKKIDIANCAGIIDGEGCFFVHHNGLNVQVQLIVVMSDEETVNFLSQTLGGQVRPIDKANKLHYRWVLCSGNAVKITRTLLPFLHGKRQQAKLFIAYYEEYYKSGRGRGSNASRNWSLLNAIESELRGLKKIRNVVDFTFGEATPVAETECEDSLLTDIVKKERCDSPNCIDGKDAELPEMCNRLN